MFNKVIRHAIGSTTLLVLLCSSSFSDEFHYNNFLIGDRASGMGGAYTAVSDDPTGLYYNPAGIVYSTGRNLSASVNAYYNLKKKYDNVIGGFGWERNSSSLLPNFFGITQPLGKFQFGFSYAVPDSIHEDQDQSFYNLPSKYAGITATQYVINFNNEDTTYNLGPSLAIEINNKLSVGMTLYLHHRNNQTIMNQFITLSNNTYEWTNQYIELVERGYRPILGFMWTPVEKVTVGISVSKTILYNSSLNGQTTYKDSTYSAGQVDRTEIGTGEKKKYPLEIRAGVAYFASNSLLVTMDGLYFSKVTDPVFGDRVSVLNAAIGTEYYFDRNWALRAGFFSDLANTPEIDPAKSGQAEKVDLFGASLSISNFTRNTSITFGGSLSSGTGKAQIISGSNSIQNVDTLGWTIFISSSYSY